MSSYGFIDSSSLLKNSFKQDTSTTDKIEDIDDDINGLKIQVNTLQAQIDLLITLINNLNSDSPTI